MSSFVNIFRLENTDGKGVYTARHKDDTCWNVATKCAYDENIHIYPIYEPYINFSISDYMFFGFASIEQYMAWCYNPVWRRELNNIGIKLSHYRVHKKYVVHGNAQSIFNKDHATLVAQYNTNVVDYDNTLIEQGVI